MSFSVSETNTQTNVDSNSTKSRIAQVEEKLTNQLKLDSMETKSKLAIDNWNKQIRKIEKKRDAAVAKRDQEIEKFSMLIKKLEQRAMAEVKTTSNTKDSKKTTSGLVANNVDPTLVNSKKTTAKKNQKLRLNFASLSLRKTRKPRGPEQPESSVFWNNEKIVYRNSTNANLTNSHISSSSSSTVSNSVTQSNSVVSGRSLQTAQRCGSSSW